MTTINPEPGTLIRSGKSRNRNLLRTNLILLFTLIMIIFVVQAIPLKEALLTRILLVVLVASGLFAADFSRIAFRILATLGSLVILVTITNLFYRDSAIFNTVMFLLNTLFFIIVTIALVAHVSGAREVFRSTLVCAINSFLLIGLNLSLMFLILDISAPLSFTEIDSTAGGYSDFIYYGFVTLTTLGYGDITPDTEMARSLSIFTAVFGQLYLVIIMALIIGKYLKDK